MDSQKMTAFFAVAQTKSFSKAADLLFKNQSAISRQILALEKELGVQLFIRGARTVALTKAGEVFKSGMEKVSDLYQTVLTNMYAAHNGYIGEVSICTHPGTLYSNLLSPVVLALKNSIRRYSSPFPPPTRQTRREALTNTAWTSFSGAGRSVVTPVEAI